MNPIQLTCEHCARPVHAGRGGVRLYDHERDAAEAAHEAHQAAQAAAVAILDPLDFALTVDDLLRPPPPARWRVEHDRCATTGKAYAIEAGRIATTADALRWTVHLMQKPWTVHTDWARFIDRLVLAPERQAASPPTRDRSDR
ncbi:hypothetical protein AB0271_00835 [Kocuria palustris]|uniref:hypothetical protein n=1 Tax=Kocuria palustris TaxID=71999 RepID=UPI00344DA259